MQLFNKKEWADSPIQNILAGLVTSIAIIPEVIGFAFVAGINPAVGLMSTVVLSFVIALLGGRPGMITGAAGAIAVLVGGLVSEYGLQYLFAASILAGIFQMILGSLGIARLVKYIPQAVMFGFFNALGLIIFLAQVPSIREGNPLFFIFLIIGLALLYVIPRYIKAIPAPLIVLAILTTISWALNLPMTRIGDLAPIQASLPSFSLPSVPLTFESFKIIAPVSLAIALVGLLETFLTLNLVDDMTHTKGNPKQEALGQGVANIMTGLFGGIAGCAMVGQSVINVKSSGTSRLSSLTTGLSLLSLLLLFSPVVSMIPMAVLVAIMITVSLSAIQWDSWSYVKTRPPYHGAALLVTMMVVLVTNNLALGVGAGLVIFYGWKKFISSNA
ncbi:sulfate permease [Dolosicoccus paucivorans]|uniref:SulP family inorganic anion transporter n=1 Tax=Dolosicoccus paucivorans TaxID=84521 RepID=UPI000C800357|nr:SulP family inorganic anion transporter [Dolosicoccus paucivorans]PMB83700.1 sulfate permease [Dolosicoccus paucivorans]